jgi:hypothetical protein
MFSSINPDFQSQTKRKRISKYTVEKNITSCIEWCNWVLVQSCFSLTVWTFLFLEILFDVTIDVVFAYIWGAKTFSFIQLNRAWYSLQNAQNKSYFAMLNIAESIPSNSWNYWIQLHSIPRISPLQFSEWGWGCEGVGVDGSVLGVCR